MTVWLICDWPDCDNHAEPAFVHHQLAGRIVIDVPSQWTGAEWATRCPEHKETP